MAEGIHGGGGVGPSPVSVTAKKAVSHRCRGYRERKDHQETKK